MSVQRECLLMGLEGNEWLSEKHQSDADFGGWLEAPAKGLLRVSYLIRRK